MKRSYRILGILLALVFAAGNPLWGQGLVAAYDFDEVDGNVAFDVSLNNNDGVFENGATRSANGQFGSAAEFNGVSGRVNLGGLDVSGNKLTITAWIRADDFGIGDARIISKSVGTANDDHIWMVSTIRSNGRRLRFRLQTTVGGTTVLIANQATLSAGVYIHVAVTYDGAQMCIYQDGVLVGSTAKTGLLVEDPSVIATIGANPVQGRYFDGLIDNVRIYSRCLSAAEIQIDSQTPAADPLVPAAPTNLAPEAVSDTQIDLSWQDSSTDETGFEVERSVNGINGPYVQITVVAADVTAYSDTDLDPNTEHCYQVRAVRNADVSGYSNPQCATTDPIPIPNAPTGLTATANGGQVELDWTDNSDNEDNFAIDRSDTGIGGPYVEIAVVGADVTVFDDFNVNPETEYCYQIRATNVSGSSGPSASGCDTTGSFNIPGLIAAYDFDEPSGDTAFDVSSNNNDGTFENGATRNANGQFGSAAEFNGVSGRVNLGGLDVPGQKLTITAWFRADDFGIGDARIISKAFGTANGDHIWMVSTIRSNGRRLRFRLQTTIGGTTTLIANQATISAGVYIHVAVTYDGTQMCIYQNGVLVGTTPKTGLLVQDPNVIATIGANPVQGRYFDGRIDNVRIYARCLSTAEIVIDSQTPAADALTPAAPTDLVLTPVSNSRIDLDWQDHATDETGFEIERSDNGVAGPYVQIAVVGAEVTTYSDTNLGRGTEYCYQVRAVRNTDVSSYTTQQCESTDPAPPPADPSLLTANATSTSEIDLAWQDNSGDETGFEIERSDNGINGPYVQITVVAADVTAYSDTNLDPNTEHCYQVRAVRNAATSGYSNPQCATTDALPPPADPSLLTANTFSSTRIDLAWQDNSGDETGFEIERSDNGINGPYVQITVVAADVTAYSDTNLDPNTEHCYQVRAVRNADVSGYSNPQCATTDPAPPPTDPSLLTANAVSPTEIDVAWQDNSGDETGFEVERSDNGIAGPYVQITIVAADVTDYSDTNLNSGNEYCYQVRAVRNADVSGYTGPECATTPIPVPNAPTGLVATENGAQVDLAWIDNSSDEDNFAIDRSENGAGGPYVQIALVNVNVIVFVDENVNPNTEYCYQIRAINVSGTSGPSNVSCDTTTNFMESSLVLEYGFEGVGSIVNDLSGSGNNGLLENGATRNPNGKFDDAAEFNGSGAFLTVGTLDLVGQEMTITCCFLADDFGTGDARIISKADGTASENHYWMISTINSNGRRLRVRLKTTDGTTTTLVADGATIVAGVFIHVAFVYDGAQIDLYQDGVCVGSAPKTGQLVANRNIEVTIGANPIGGRYFDGLIDNVRIYDRALSPPEIDLDRITPAGQPLQTTPPDAPGNLMATAASASEIQLTWQDNSPNEFNFEIERSIEGGPFQLIATTDSDVTAFSDTVGVVPDTEFCYQVRATNAFGESDYTSVMCDTTPLAPNGPSAPNNFSATPLSQIRVVLGWFDTSGTETGFEVERSNVGIGGPYTPLPDAAANQETYYDDTVAANASYWYRIRAVNAGGVSSYVGPLNAETFVTSILQETLFDTGVFEVSEDGPYYPTLQHGQNEFQTHVPLPDFDYTSPVDLTSGRVYQRMDVVERPSLVSFCAQKQIQETGFNGDHWWPSKPTIIDPEIYTIDHLWLSMRDATGLADRWDDPPPLRMAFAVQCAGGDPNSPYSDPDIFPMFCRFSWVLVADGGTFTGWEAIVGPDRPILDPLGLPFFSYNNPVTVTMTTATHNGEIRYTTNGQEPTNGSALYTSSFQVNVTTTVKAKTFKPGVPPSDTTTVIYQIQ